MVGWFGVGLATTSVLGGVNDQMPVSILNNHINNSCFEVPIFTDKLLPPVAMAAAS